MLANKVHLRLKDGNLLATNAYGTGFDIRETDYTTTFTVLQTLQELHYKYEGIPKVMSSRLNTLISELLNSLEVLRERGDKGKTQQILIASSSVEIPVQSFEGLLWGRTLNGGSTIINILAAPHHLINEAIRHPHIPRAGLTLAHYFLESTGHNSLQVIDPAPLVYL